MISFAVKSQGHIRQAPSPCGCCFYIGSSERKKCSSPTSPACICIALQISEPYLLLLKNTDMNNQQLMDQGNQLMDETDQAIARSKQVSLMLWKCLCTPCTPGSGIIKNTCWSSVNKLWSLHSERWWFFFYAIRMFEILWCCPASPSLNVATFVLLFAGLSYAYRYR
jgi:hypothetical protein